jgi:hypothetical protein
VIFLGCSSYFVVDEVSFVVCGFSRNIRAAKCFFIVYEDFGCL